MSIGVKVVERPIEQTSYVRATLTGMAHTIEQVQRPCFGDELFQRDAQFFAMILSGLRDDRSRANAIDADIMRRQVHGHVPGHLHDRRLAGAVCDELGLRHETGD